MSAPAAVPLTQGRFPLGAALAAVFLVVFGVRLLTISTYGSALPFYDEWDAGAAALYKPYLDGTQTIWSLLGRLNEHIIFTSQVLNLGLLELAGEWNPRLQMVVNGAIYAGFATAFTATLLPLLPTADRLKLVAVALVMFAPPIDTEIVMMGMNAHFYFVVIFSVLALRWWVGQPAFSWRWIAGFGLGGLAYLSMASGAVTPLVAALVGGLQLVRSDRKGIAEWLGLGLLVATGVAMVAAVPSLAHHEVYRAHDAGQFLAALTTLASLPLASIVGVVIVQAPIVFYFAQVLRGKPGRASLAWLVVGLAGWVAGQYVLVAYGRATDVLNSRYLVCVPLLMVLHYAAVLQLGGGRWTRRLAAAWLFLIVFAVAAVTNVATWRALGRHDARMDVQQAAVMAFLADDDAARFVADPEGVPHSNANVVIAMLRDPAIRAILPAEIRPKDADRSIVETRTLLGGRLAEPVRSILKALLDGAALVIALGIACFVVALHRGAAPAEQQARS